MIYRSNTIGKNFDSIKNDLDSLQDIIEKSMLDYENMLNANSVQSFIRLNVESIDLRLVDSDSYHNKHKRIQLSLPKELIKGMKKEGLELGNMTGLSFGRMDNVLYFAITNNNKENLVNLINFLDLVAEFDKKSHELNLKIAKSNLAISEGIFNLLNKVGIKTSYQDYKTSRSRTKSTINYNFPSEIKKQIPTGYSEKYLTDRVDNLKSNVNRYFKDEILKIEKALREEEENAKKKHSLKKQALLLAKYDLDLDCDWKELLEVILDKNKYLKLAYYLERNRGDWGEGYDYAETGLSYFPVESELDQKIVDNIESYMYENWDGDGRVFRDCTYNYSTLYGMVDDSKLLEDFEYVSSNIDMY